MSYIPSYINGSWNVICDQCGRVYKVNELRLRWDGLMVCSGDWEPRQPQDYVHGVADKMVPPFTRSEPPDRFIFFCTIYSNQGVADFATAGCAQADIDNGYRVY